MCVIDLSARLSPIMSNNGVLLCQTIILALICSNFAKEFTNDWVVHLKRGANANEVAKRHGFENLGQVRWQYSVLSLRNVCTFVVIVTRLDVY